MAGRGGVGEDGPATAQCADSKEQALRKGHFILGRERCHEEGDRRLHSLASSDERYSTNSYSL